MEVVAAIIHDSAERIFATQRGYGEWKDFWEFPGGKMEAGETPEEALRREIWEELETRVVVERLAETVEWDYPQFHLTMHCYWCRVESGHLDLKEHEAAKWLSLSEIDSVNWLPADKKVVDNIKGSGIYVGETSAKRLNTNGAQEGSGKQEQTRRSANMAAIKSKDTKPEMTVRKGLWRMGFRYRLNHKRLPGHPDLVLRKYRTCIFVNGCFWHGHHVQLSAAPVEGLEQIVNSACCKIPKTNREFWVTKIRRNKERDKEEQRRLAEMGWHCITVWECDLKPAKREETLKSLAFTLNRIWLNDHSAKRAYPDISEEDDGMLKAAEE